MGRQEAESSLRSACYLAQAGATAIPAGAQETEAAMSSSEIPTQGPKGAGEPPAGSRRCLRCGGERREPGGLATLGGLSFYPANSTFWTLSPNVAIQAFLCLDCGNIELVGDVKRAE